MDPITVPPNHPGCPFRELASPTEKGSVMKRFGEASTSQERQLETAIAQIDAWHGASIHYSPVGGGISNMNWRVQIEGAPNAYFFKVPGPGTEMFINRHTAHEASVKAAETGYGAPVLTFLQACGVEIFEFMEGWKASTNLDFADAQVRHKALRALKAFNNQPLLSETKTVLDMIDEHQAQVETLGARTPPDHEWLCRQFERARAALTASGIDLRPCMNDTLAGNFMLNQARDILLVDFEYASNNDPHYELALWFGEMFFTPDMELALVEEYFGSVTSQTLARIAVNKALADLKWATWAMVQRAISCIDFDFYKYGAWKHMRARAVMHDSRWESWLKEV
ncbi:choline kinase family protein [Robbsia andropogonis]|nr:choline kinase family protein [Robbsia andropogonis]